MEIILTALLFMAGFIFFLLITAVEFIRLNWKIIAVSIAISLALVLVYKAYAEEVRMTASVESNPCNECLRLCR